MLAVILTTGRTGQFMKLFSKTFCKIRKSFSRFFVPQFLRNVSFCVTNYVISLYFFFNHENFNLNGISNTECPRTGESDLKGIFLIRNGGEKP
jgi:hypothetical protein